jgi:putative SOS response-associated peptidase YedK
MCGRYTQQHSWGELVEIYRIPEPEIGPRKQQPTYNATPTQALPVVRPVEGGRQLVMANWGLIPHWLRDLTQKPHSTINARSDRIREAPTYRDPFKRSRCLVPMSGWYEWQAVTPKKKQPFYLRARSEPVAFAGVMDTWTGDGREPITSFALVTTEPADSIRYVHHRMPLVLDEAHFETWMRGTPDEAAALMVPYAGELEAWEVSTRVNRPANDDASLIEPLAAKAPKAAGSLL